MDSRIIDEIRKIVGKDNVIDSLEERKCYSYDARTDGIVPDLIVFPSSAQEVSGILKLANQHFFPVIPRGQGTGLTGGSTPVVEGVVLVFTRMNRILEIDSENLIAVVEPGVITFNLQQEAAKQGLFYPPDPASYKYSSIGGNVAECAGGPNSLKYGVTRDYVIGLEVVKPTGRDPQYRRAHDERGRRVRPHAPFRRKRRNARRDYEDHRETVSLFRKPRLLSLRFSKR